MSSDYAVVMIDVREAARLTSRNPETVRRWVWSGQLAAERRGRRLLVARDDVLRMVGLESEQRDRLALAEWGALVRGYQRADTETASDLVIEDRRMRSDVQL